jgi:RNA polymerase sigma factor (sigma-70 family)
LTDDFETLWERHASSLLAFLVYRTGDRHESEDLVAETFERAMRKRGLFNRRRGSERTWLYAIALNALRDRGRRAAAEGRAVERLEEPSQADGFERVNDRDALRTALRSLSDEEREAVALRFGADFTLAEIAQATGEKQTTVDGRVYRALRKLKEALE